MATPKCALKPDAIVPRAELLEISPNLETLCQITGQGVPTVEDMQRAIAAAVLSPKVPESVAHTFRMAKKLFVFGYFEYGFNVICHQYAFSAIQSALQIRWIRTLPNPVLVQIGLNKPYEERTGEYEKYFDMSLRHGKIKLDGKKFPNTTKKVIDKLQGLGIIKTHEKMRIEAGIDLRNSFIHPEQVTVVPPDPNVLFTTADVINTLFER